MSASKCNIAICVKKRRERVETLDKNAIKCPRTKTQGTKYRCVMQGVGECSINYYATDVRRCTSRGAGSRVVERASEILESLRRAALSCLTVSLWRLVRWRTTELTGASMGSSSESEEAAPPPFMVGSWGKIKVGRVGIKTGAEGLVDRLR